MTKIVIGEYNGEDLVYETSETNSVVLAVLTKLLISTFMSFGIKALCELITSKKFRIKYPGGNLKLIYKLLQQASDDPNHKKCDFSLSLDNVLN